MRDTWIWAEQGKLGTKGFRVIHGQWWSQEVLFGGATININHISKQQKT